MSSIILYSPKLFEDVFDFGEFAELKLIIERVFALLLDSTLDESETDICDADESVLLAFSELLLSTVINVESDAILDWDKDEKILDLIE